MRSKSSDPQCGFSLEELKSVRPGMDPYVNRCLPAQMEPAPYTVERRDRCTVYWLGGGQGTMAVAALRKAESS
jgi:hypothetical protein